MASSRRRNLLRSRRRVAEDGEDEGSFQDVADDSPSESIPSDAEDDVDADGEDSDLSEGDTPDAHPSGKGDIKMNGSGDKEANSKGSGFVTVKDTEAMMNGLRISDEAATAEPIDFENDAKSSNGAVREPRSTSTPAEGKGVTPAERRKREHEEYKKKRDADPAFIPNRGAFFMHDHRSAAPGQNGFRPFGRGRGRGRGVVGGSYSPANAATPSSEVTDSPWAHDLHDTINEPDSRQPAPKSNHSILPKSGPMEQKMEKPLSNDPANSQPRSFSKSTHVSNVQIRVLLVGMKAPIVFSAAPNYVHTRLPNHRPPLRRDKPVRISLPDQAPRYIFPSADRSFIFIPRALRPNQQGFGRSRGRGNFGGYGGYGGYGGFSSRRTSAYGGSMYSPSVAVSRRSSMARDIHRDGLVSPAGSIMSRPSVAPDHASKPVVRLPPGATAAGAPPAGSTISNIPQPQNYPLPQKPAFRENWPANVPMHQPRPQKAVSVAGIESPASLNYPVPLQPQELPFHQQVPPAVNGQQGGPPSGDSSQYYPSQPHSRQMSYPSQPSGTPLSNIPERSIHAQPFQPYQQGYQPNFQPHGYPQPPYFYPAPANGGQPQYAGMQPLFVPSQGYVMPMQGMQMQPSQSGSQPPGPTSPSQTGQPGVVAHESNGMVYYIDPHQMYQAPPVEGYPPTSYAVPGPGGMMTPTPEGYYYPPMGTTAPNGTVYYPPQ